MPSATLPWFKWWVADWRLSARVKRLAPAQRGAYVDLLCLQWAYGSIPVALPDVMALMDRAYTDFDVAPVLHEFFPVVEDGVGGVVRRNPRLQQERERADRTHANRAKAGRRSAKRRARKSLEGHDIHGHRDGHRNGNLGENTEYYSTLYSKQDSVEGTESPRSTSLVLVTDRPSAGPGRSVRWVGDAVDRLVAHGGRDAS